MGRDADQAGDLPRCPRAANRHHPGEHDGRRARERAAVIAPGLFRYLETARKSNAKSTIRVLEGAITLFQAQVGQFPTKLSDLIKAPRDEKLRKKWDGPYIKQKEIPNDPWGNKYQYRITPQGDNSYELYSYGPKGKGATKTEWISVWDED